MIHRLLYVLVAAALLFSVASCDDTGFGPTSVEVEAMMWEAERAVVMLGYDPGEAPQLVEEMANDIRRIRERFGGLFEIGGHRVHFPWYAYGVRIYLSPEGEALLASGHWPELDDAVAACGADSVGMDCGGRMVYFSQPTNPCRTRSAFAEVEHVTWRGPKWWALICDDPCGFIWPIPTDAGMDYLLEYRFDGDANSEPEPSTYYYFSATRGGGVRYVDSYLPGVYPTPYNEDTPRWLLEFDRFQLYGCGE